jgi:NADH dehydrogenase
LICVTGAAGYIGSHSAWALAEGGEALRAFVRPTTDDEETGFFQQLGAEVVEGEATDPEALGRALKGCRAVLHCVGGIQPSRPGDFHGLHEGPAEALADAGRATDLELVVLVSAVGSRHEADNAYHQSKARAEEILRAGPWTTTVVRPSLVYGQAGGLRESKLMTRLESFFRRGRPLPLPQGGRALIQPLFVGDLARALALSTSKALAAGQTVELGGPERMTLREWVERVAMALGLKPRLVPLPLIASLAAAAVAEKLSASPPITVDQVRVMAQNFIAPLDSVQGTYGFAPATPAEGLRRTYGPKPEPDQ